MWQKLVDELHCGFWCFTHIRCQQELVMSGMLIVTDMFSKGNLLRKSLCFAQVHALTIFLVCTPARE